MTTNNIAQIEALLNFKMKKIDYASLLDRYKDIENETSEEKLMSSFYDLGMDDVFIAFGLDIPEFQENDKQNNSEPETIMEQWVRILREQG